ncbi:MAG: ABC transporter ATP-binding protein [Caldilineae bacterium]|nr:MAG: ABC transporter ATP-binding protein [Caldilineae bacterium]
MDSTPAVELCDVVKTFGEVTAVDHVSIQIQDGEFFSLLGPSGCGKTTTLRLIAGFEMPTSGEIRIGGETQGFRPPFRRPVNTVFQQYALFPHMTVYENVAFGLQMQKIDRAEIRRRVGEALEMVHLQGMEKRRPKQLSGGQQQRVALARALVNRPKVLLLDEPLGALDLKLRKAMQLELKSLQEHVGITFIYVTHDQEEALTMSDRIAVMNEGKVLQIDAPAELYENPKHRFVADFIGETNFLPVKIVQLHPDIVVELGDGTRLPAGWAEEHLRVGQEAMLSIRPEKINLYEERELSPPNATTARVQGTVERLVYVGTDTHHTVRLRNGDTIVARLQNFYVEEEPWEVGETTYAQWDAAHARVLSKE